MFRWKAYLLCLILSLLPSIGCSSSWHDKVGWKAENFFDDPQVIALCQAIEANDLEEIDRLVAAGANVNAKGKGNMTPLLWAYSDNKLERFVRLLEHGADPNVTITSDFNSHGAVEPGDSVTHMASKTWFPGYFEAVFEHGGDPNLVRKSETGKGDTPLFSLIKGSAPDKKLKVKILIDKGADLNHKGWAEATLAEVAVGAWGQFDIALMLLEAGAPYKTYQYKSNSRLVHTVLSREPKPHWSPQQVSDREKLLHWLEEHGESIEEAKADRERWKSWSITTGEYRRNMDREIAARKAREAKEKQEP